MRKKAETSGIAQEAAPAAPPGRALGGGSKKMKILVSGSCPIAPNLAADFRKFQNESIKIKQSIKV